jgi:hypothetical protein
MAEPLAKPENKFRTFYHGTYPDRIDSILRTGLDPSYVGGGGGTLPGLNEKDPRPKIFLTTSPSYAEFYAAMAAKTSAMAKAKEEGKGWIRQMLATGTPASPLRIDLPNDFKVNELGKGLYGDDEHYVTDLISPKYIKAMNRLEKAAAFGAMMGKIAASADRPGLWANIRAKKQRGESTAKPGDKDYPDAKNWKKVTDISEKKAESPAWQRSEGKNPDGGLNNKGRASLKANGQNIKRPQPEGGPRRDSFCARMGGMKAKLTSDATANDPDSRINKALRKWNC